MTDGGSAAADLRVGVVISTLDRPELLRRCLDSLQRGERPPDEVVVVDQGIAAPGDAVVADAKAAGLPVVRVTQSRRGLAASQNLGFRTSTCDVVAVIDDDCVADSRWLDVAVDAFALGANDGLQLLAGRILSLPPNGDRVLAVSNRTSTRREDHSWPVVPWVVGSGGNFVVDRAAYLAVGGNDERLGTGTPGRAGNDMDLFYRLLRRGGVARYEPELVVFHERATVEERRIRRGSYGFGVGACVGRWLRDGDRWAWHALAAWAKLRLQVLVRERSLPALDDELRIAAGTLQGLRYGWRLRTAWGPDAGGG